MVSYKSLLVKHLIQDTVILRASEDVSTVDLMLANIFKTIQYTDNVTVIDIGLGNIIACLMKFLELAKIDTGLNSKWYQNYAQYLYEEWILPVTPGPAKLSA